MIREKKILVSVSLVLVEVLLLFVFFSFTNGNNLVLAVVGSPNVTVQTLLQVGNVYPEVLNVSINNDAASISLSPNATVIVNCTGVFRDYNGEDDIIKVNGTFYAATTSNTSAPDDNNYHYTNTSCVINTSFGSYNGYNDDQYSVLGNCTFEVEYYAVPEPWECELMPVDGVNWTDADTDNVTMNQLLGIGLPDTIDYGLVNSTFVSDEQTANVTNYGNVFINLSLEGYAYTLGDGDALNCSWGNIQNISIEYEKYNLTDSIPGQLSLSEFEGNYTNLTSGTPQIRFYNLTLRYNDTVNEAVKQSYWRTYVPAGVAGNCTGNIVFGATTAAAS